MPPFKRPTPPITTPPVATRVAVRADVRTGELAMLPVRSDIERKIVRVVVDTHLYLPDMFEITFQDDEGLAAEQMKVGLQVEIRSGADPEGRPPLIRGEITSLEAICEDMMTYFVVRGYDLSHALHRGRRTRTFLNTKDSGIVQRIVAEAKLKTRNVIIDDTRTVHGHMAQVAQTDWDFLQARARANGFEVGVKGDTFYFRRATGTPPGPAQPAAPPVLTFGEGLISFLPRLTTESLPRQVEVRTWDQAAAAVVSATAAVRPVTPGADPAGLLPGLTAAKGPSTAAGKTPATKPKAPGKGPGAAGAGMLAGLASDPGTYVLVDRPVGSGAGIMSAAQSFADGIAEQVGATAAEAEGYTFGDSAIQAGQAVEVGGVPAPFCGTWTVSNARHTFCDDEGGHYTRFFVTGRNGSTPSDTAAPGPDKDADRWTPGMMWGIVTDVADPEQRNRVKVSLPLLSPDFTTDWARLVYPGGNRGGAVFVPDVGDEVLVAFECDDINRPVVIGGMRNDASATGLGAHPVQRKGETAGVVRRGLTSSSGSKLSFVEVPAHQGAAEESAMVLATYLNDLGLTINKTTGQVQLVCKPAVGKAKGRGVLTISTDQSGTVTIDAGPKGTVNVTGGSVDVHASRKLSLRSDGELEIKGTKVKVTGTTIDLN